jgi:hypothetical protein
VHPPPGEVAAELNLPQNLEGWPTSVNRPSTMRHRLQPTTWIEAGSGILSRSARDHSPSSWTGDATDRSPAVKASSQEATISLI